MKGTKRIYDHIRTGGVVVKTTVFIAVFGAAVFVMTHDFGGTLARSRDRFDLLASVMRVREEYYGISPYWLERYGIALKDESDLASDQDGDGLSLADEYRYLTDPFDPDSDHDGYPDGAEVENGYSPTGEGRLDMNRNGLPDSWEDEHALPTDRDTAEDDADGDGLSGREEYAHGTDPNAADSDGDGFDDAREIRNGYDPSAPGDARPAIEIVMDRIGVVAPVVLSEDADETAIQRDLERGLIRYPGTAVPGQPGNAFVTGHSSNYAWAAGQYNHILSRLDTLEEGDSVSFRVVQANGKSLSYDYRVVKKFIAAPDDPRLFQEEDASIVTLATCWPLNTSWKRLVVKAELGS